jgi:hypothetical protein
MRYLFAESSENCDVSIHATQAPPSSRFKTCNRCAPRRAS